jgi:UDP-N-acetylmuramate dehydrogenase
MSDLISRLQVLFGERLQENVPLAHFTTARVGGPADALLPLNSVEELAQAVGQLWSEDIPFILLGGGSNVLISDRGVRGLVLVNRTRNGKIDVKHGDPTLLAESGANLGGLVRQAALRGLGGLEWAANIPGSVGGAVYGNAGANGSDIHANLVMAEILHPQKCREWWPIDQMGFSYRNSTLKSEKSGAVILSAKFKLIQRTVSEAQALIDGYSEKRRRTQPPGASLGSMFKNPSGDYAGRLIEAAGLKGRAVGGAEISPIHANFFVNSGSATAMDIWKLIELARNTVFKQTGVHLELEIERIGAWDDEVASE